MNASLRRFLVLAGVAVLFFAGVSFAQPANHDHPWTIRPGEGIGSIEIFMEPEEVVSAAGQPDERKAEGSWWVYRDPGVIVLFPLPGESHHFTLLLKLHKKLLAPRVPPRTAEGIGLDSTKDEVIAAFGPPEQSQDFGERVHYGYPSKGIDFALRDGRVEEITVSQDHRKPRSAP